MEGESLAAFLERHGSLTPAQWRPWLDALLAGIEHVHHRDYLHRDIKPANVVIRADAAGGRSWKRTPLSFVVFSSCCVFRLTASTELGQNTASDYSFIRGATAFM